MQFISKIFHHFLSVFWEVDFFRKMFFKGDPRSQNSLIFMEKIWKKKGRILKSEILNSVNQDCLFLCYLIFHRKKRNFLLHPLCKWCKNV